MWLLTEAGLPRTEVVHVYGWNLFVTGACNSFGIATNIFTLLFDRPDSYVTHKEFRATLEFRLERVGRQLREGLSLILHDENISLYLMQIKILN